MPGAILDQHLRRRRLEQLALFLDRGDASIAVDVRPGNPDSDGARLLYDRVLDEGLYPRASGSRLPPAARRWWWRCRRRGRRGRR